MTRRMVLGFLASVGLLVASEARADIIPDGLKPIRYTFALANASAFPDWVILAHPYTTSYGAPRTQLGVVGDTPMILGRYYEPILHAMKKSDYDASGLAKMEGKEIPAFFETTDKLLSSKVRVSPLHYIPEAWPVKEAHDVYRIEKLEAGVFVARFAQVVYTFDDGQKKTLEVGPDGKRPDPVDAAPAAAASVAGSSSSPSASPAHAPSGCGGCTVKGEEGAAGLVLGLGLLAAFRGRRRAQSRRPEA